MKFFRLLTLAIIIYSFTSCKKKNTPEPEPEPDVAETVFVGNYDHNLYALDAATGVKKWESATGGEIYSSPSVANGIVYVGSNDKKLHAFDAMYIFDEFFCHVCKFSDSRPFKLG